MRQRPGKAIVIATIVSLFGAGAAIGAISTAQLQQARTQFLLGHFPTAIQMLAPYDRQPPRRLSLDFMLAVSKCRTGNIADGRRRLARLPADYALTQSKAADISAQLLDCGQGRLPAVAGLDGKADRYSFARVGGSEAASSGTPQMSGFEYGWSYNQGDLYSVRTNSAMQCANVCLRDGRCRAMTWVGSQRMCWIKNRLTGRRGQSGDMISSMKLYD